MSPLLTDDPQREFAIAVVQRLRDAGHEALWAGGCVRDALLGKPPKDYDVATAALPDQVREVFGKRRTIAVGAAFGVITVLGPRPAGQIEVATFRTDVSYTDGRRPDEVRFTTAKEDASRRDFTINGLFYDPIDGRVIDYVRGQADISARVIRAIGDPVARFEEDRLRMLRAVRFAASLGFEIDPATAEAIRAHSDALPSVSPERIGAELRRMLTEGGGARALELLESTGLLPVVLPCLAGSSSNLAASRERLTRIESPTAALALAATVAESASPSEGAAIARSLKWTGKEWDRVAWLIEHRHSLDGAESRPWSQVQPLLASDGGHEIVELRRSFLDQADATDAFCRERLGWPADRLDPAPLLDGADLIAAGEKPGPEFARLLSRVRAAQLDGEVADKAAALQLLGR